MDRRWEFEAVTRAIVALCHTSLPADELRSGVLQELGQLIPAVESASYRAGYPAL